MRKILIFLSLAFIALSCNDFTTSPDTETETRLVCFYSVSDTIRWSSTTEDKYDYYLNFVLYGLEPTEPLKFSLKQINLPANGTSEPTIGEAGKTYEDLSNKVFEFAPGQKSILVPMVLLRDEDRLNNSSLSAWETKLTLVPLTDDLRVIGGGSFTLVEKKK